MERSHQDIHSFFPSLNLKDQKPNHMRDRSNHYPLIIKHVSHNYPLMINLSSLKVQQPVHGMQSDLHLLLFLLLWKFWLWVVKCYLRVFHLLLLRREQGILIELHRVGLTTFYSVQCLIDQLFLELRYKSESLSFAQFLLSLDRILELFPW